MKKILCAIALVASIAGVSIAGASPASASSHNCVHHTWQQGSSSGCVRIIKGMLNLSIGSALNTADPYFDGWTGVGVMIFQQNKNYTVDAIVGPITWGGLCADMAYYAGAGNTDAAIYHFFAGCGT